MEEYIDSDGQVLKIEVDVCGTNWYYNSNNKLHRLDGPAIEYKGGYFFWYKKGRLHRINGPAYFNHPNHYEWFINGKQINIYYIYG